MRKTRFLFFNTVHVHIEIMILIVTLARTTTSTTLNHPINNIPNPQLASNTLNILNRILPKQRLKYTSNKIDHNNIPLLLQHPRKLSKQPHPLFIDDQRGRLGDRGRFGLDVAPEERGEFEDGVRGDMGWEVFVAFALVSDVDETVVDAHLEFVGGGITWPLFSVKLFETLQS